MVRCQRSDRLRPGPGSLDLLCARHPLCRGLLRAAAVCDLAGLPAKTPQHMSRWSRILILVALIAASFSLATLLQPRVAGWNKRGQDESVLKLLLGDTRRVLANHLFIEADIYFHSGYYPSIFDRGSAPVDTKHMAGQEGEGHDHEAEHEKEMAFLKPPRDWIEAFGRHFFVTRHTHLEAGREREILPWLKAAAELDPQHIETYTVAAYWLRSRLGKIKEAEEFLRE